MPHQLYALDVVQWALWVWMPLDDLERICRNKKVALHFLGDTRFDSSWGVTMAGLTTLAKVMYPAKDVFGANTRNRFIERTKQRWREKTAAPP